MKTAKVNVCFNQRGGLYESTVCRGIYLLGGRDIGSFDELAIMARVRVVPNVAVSRER